MPPVGKKVVAGRDFRFDFGSDPSVVKQRREFDSHLRKVAQTDGESVLPPGSFSCSADGQLVNCGYFSKPSSKAAHRASASVSNAKNESHFKMASGRPIVKEVLAVTSIETEAPPTGDFLGKERFATKRRLGGVAAQFCAPKFGRSEEEGGCALRRASRDDNPTEKGKREGWKSHESLRRFDDSIVDLIESEIMSKREVTGWGDLAGLHAAKESLKEIVVLPFLRPDIFKGIRAPPKGVLLFGPPGTGKTMIGRCVASQCKATFFNIAASSLTSKWVGDGEKLVRALFAIARILQPSIIFIDEIDSLLTSRSEGDHESSRRIKTEFLIHLDGVATCSDEQILVLGATNRPQELDDAAKRRFAKRLYIGLPSAEARASIVRGLVGSHAHDLSDADFDRVGEITAGYSGADVKALCTEAAMCPLREIMSTSVDISTIRIEQVRPISLQDFERSLQNVPPTVHEKDLESYVAWDKQFGSLAHSRA